jgi:hypothetical protein
MPPPIRVEATRLDLPGNEERRPGGGGGTSSTTPEDVPLRLPRGTDKRVKPNAVMTTVLHRLRVAYGLRPEQINGGPEWASACPEHRIGPRITWRQHNDGRVTLGPCNQGCTPAEILGWLVLDDPRILDWAEWKSMPAAAASARTSRTTAPGGGRGGFEILADALRDAGCIGSGGKSGYESPHGWIKAKCPACGAAGDGHGVRVDRQDVPGKRSVLIHPFCGCSTEDVLAAVGVAWEDLLDGDEVDDLGSGELPPLPPEPMEPPQPPEPPRKPAAGPGNLADVHRAFRRWMGRGYDLAGADAVLAAAAVERLDGDPVWLLMISGSGNAKTETVNALLGAGAHVVSTVTGEAALLSATAKRERSKDATGGLLREIGDRGLLVIKDVTSILSMSRDRRNEVLGALREIHDGAWTRKVGVDGGRSFPWTGRIVLVGAVTTAWDTAHAAIAVMGDRFALVRVDSTKGRSESGRQALRNVGHEVQMRAELADVAGRVLAAVRPELATLTEQDMDELLDAADLVTYARTAVERDHRGEVVDAHAPEAPTRFAKALGQILRGGLAVGMTRDHALAVARRVARDSMPPLRLMLLADVMDHPDATTSEVTKRVQKPRTTVDRGLQELHLLGLLAVGGGDDGDPIRGRAWRYTLTDRVNPDTLSSLVNQKWLPHSLLLTEEENAE